MDNMSLPPLKWDQQRIERLSPAERKRTFSVEADVITPEHISFECPFCWSKYKKNGEPYKTAKRLRHIHGNELRTSENRVITRSPHCIRPNELNGQFIINITEKTVRKWF